jgi:hypothetical protein
MDTYNIFYNDHFFPGLCTTDDGFGCCAEHANVLAQYAADFRFTVLSSSALLPRQRPSS